MSSRTKSFIHCSNVLTFYNSTKSTAKVPTSNYIFDVKFILPGSPAGEVSFWLEREGREPDDDGRGEEESLDDDVDVVKRYHHADRVGLHGSLERDSIFSVKSLCFSQLC